MFERRLIAARLLFFGVAFAVGARCGCEPWVFARHGWIIAFAAVAVLAVALAWRRIGLAGRTVGLCAIVFLVGAAHAAAQVHRGLWFKLDAVLTPGVTVGGLFEVRSVERGPTALRLSGVLSDAVVAGRPVPGRDVLRIETSVALPVGTTPLKSMWRVKGRLSLPRDWRARGARLHVRDRDCRMVRAGRTPLFDVAAFRDRAERLLDPDRAADAEAGALLKAIVLGVSGERLDVFDLFSRSGTLHVFAVSGLHVGIICVIVVFLLRATGMTRNRWAFVLVPMFVGYAAVTGWRASAVRACIMAGAYFAACALNRAPNSRSALGMAVAVIVALDYHRVFDVGFLFSATVVWMLIDWYSFVLHRLPGRGSSVLDTALHRTAGALRQRVRELLALSITAWIGSLPLTAYFFGRISIVGIVANLFAVPLAFAIVVSGCLAILCGAVLPALGAVYGNAGIALLDLLTVLCQQLIRLPFASLEVDPPSAGIVVAWYILLACARPVLIPSTPVCNDETGEPIDRGDNDDEDADGRLD